MRNNKFNIVSCVIVYLFLMACNDQYKENGNYSPSLSLRYLRPSESKFDASSKGGNLRFSVESVSAPWEFTNTQSWFSLSPRTATSSADVSLSVQENPSADSSRVAIFYLQSTSSDWQYKKTMYISQGVAEPYISFSNTNVDFAGSSSSQTIKVTCNFTWEAKASENWISLKVNRANNELTIEVDSNPTSNYRTGDIRFYYNGSVFRNLKIKQAPSQITTSDATLSVSNVASKVTIELDAESDWTAQVSDSWVSVNPNKGSAGKKSVEISVLPNETVNERTAYVSFLTNGNQKAQIKIVQEGLYLRTDITSLDFRSKGETKTLNVFSNTDWEVMSVPDWIKLSASKGNGDAELEVSAEGNQSLTSRSGTILIQKNGLDLKTSISVEQDLMTLNVNAPKIAFSHKAEETNIDITADFPWYSSVSDTWITTDPTQGTGDATIKVSVTENNSYNERLGTILYAMSEATLNVRVEQDAKYFIVDAKPFDFTSKGGVVTISFATNETWTAKFNDAPNWVKLSSNSGEGSAELVITVSDNPSVNKRSTQLMIETPLGQALCVPITQDARYLIVNTQTLTFYAKGGSADIVVDTDGTFEAVSSSNWLHVNKQENTITVTADNNEGDVNRQSSISISLSDLIEGEVVLSIPVLQIGKGGTFSWENYLSDIDWNINSQSEFSISIVDYQIDNSWNQELDTYFTIRKLDYSNDMDWN